MTAVPGRNMDRKPGSLNGAEDEQETPGVYWDESIEGVTVCLAWHFHEAYWAHWGDSGLTYFLRTHCCSYYYN